MRNVFIGEKTAHDIDTQVLRVLRDLGNPEPPLALEEVLDLLKLDKHYYSAEETTVLQEVAHKLVVAGKQVLLRPGLLLDAVKKCNLKALYLPDRKRILIDSTIPAPKQRWAEAHELGHGIIPWHQPLMHGDQQKTLSPHCAAQVEAEANLAAAKLLFFRGRYMEELLAQELTFSRVRDLSKSFGNSMTTGLWWCVASLGVPAIGMISTHPGKAQGYTEESVRYFIRSKGFAERFGKITEAWIFAQLCTYCRGGRGPLGEKDISVADDASQAHVFHFETFHNGYDAMTLGVYRASRSALVSLNGSGWKSPGR